MKHWIKAVSVVTVILGAMVLIAPPAAAGGFCRGTELTQGTGDAVIMKGMCYEPVVLFTEPGTEVSFTNLDKAPHTVTGSGGWGTAHDQIFVNKTRSFSFKKEGVYPYVCLLHPGMVGAVVVGDGRDGKLSASNVGFVPPSDTDVGSAEPAPAAAPATATSSSDYGALALVLGIAVMALIAVLVGVFMKRRRVALERTAPTAEATG